MRVLSESRNNSHRENGKDRKKTEITLFDVCSSCRALVISGMDLALRASSYAHSMPLIAITTVITSIEKQKQRLGKPGKWVRLSMATGTKIKFFLNM